MMQVVPNSFETLPLPKELVLSAKTQLSTNMYYLKYILPPFGKDNPNAS